MNEKLIELLKNEEFCIEFFDTFEKIDGLKALLERNGITITDDEVQELIKIAKQQISKADNEELCENELDDVSGGLVGWVIAGVASGIFFGYQVYKSRKAINSWYCNV